MAELRPLRQIMIEDMTIRNLSPATQRSYISAVSKLSQHFGRSPDRLDVEDIRAFQVHLAGTGISWPGLNQIVCALRFFYGMTLGRTDIPELIPYAREPHMRATPLGGDIYELLAHNLAVVGAGPNPRQPRQGLVIIGLRASSHAALATPLSAHDRLGQAVTGTGKNDRVHRPATLDCEGALGPRVSSRRPKRRIKSLQKTNVFL